MSHDVETVVWCPRCRVDKFEVRRVPTGNENVMQHVIYPEVENTKTCECGTALVRKP